MTRDRFVAATVDLRRVERGLRDVLRRAERAGPFFRDERKPLRADQRDHAKRRQGPDGSWPARVVTPGKPRRKRRRLLGRLPGAVSIAASADAVRAVSKVPWSGVHQHGGRVGRGARIPARTFLYFSPDYLRAMAERFAAYAVAQWGRRGGR
jgi:phage gpG-like protein